MHWALDLGTTNSLVARWDADADRPRVIRLRGICRSPDGDDPLAAPAAIPSVVHSLPPTTLVGRLGLGAWLKKVVLWGRWGWIGQPALEKSGQRDLHSDRQGNLRADRRGDACIWFLLSLFVHLVHRAGA